VFKYTFKIANYQQSFAIFTDMKEKTTYVIGLMSGTSLDGLDLVYVKFTQNKKINFEILHHKTVAYSAKWKANLQQAITFKTDVLQKLDTNYGKLLANITNQFIADFKIQNIHFIASHGHTVFHDPANGVTLQIGNGPELSKYTNQKVICDFRTQDVVLGGQGAPLVPIGDELLFSEYDYCLNLGGFANISMQQNNKRIAFDICPVNIVMNHYANQLGLAYDDGGKIAKTGEVNVALLNKLNALPFYQQPFPKSLGLEWVKKNIFPLIDSYTLSVPDILRTFIEHVAIQITHVLTAQHKTLFITGGGVYNTFLIKRMQQLSSVSIVIPAKEIIEYKEALIFALLGLLREQNNVNVLASVTGAKKDHSSGKIYL